MKLYKQQRIINVVQLNVDTFVEMPLVEISRCFTSCSQSRCCSRENKRDSRCQPPMVFISAVRRHV